ncbi:hypothetical protein FBUS_08421 [Fasciolopsis buskii]|uniref:Tetraspanin n=1 Tax=Fasciolopsis buskii TaxID=27845 RepID=A0A8E0RU94_9TREM|nr:hypothetical protein FBUS_08421 [Fasciolopsis buski]
METTTLRERLCILQCLHGLFIITLLCTGTVGLGLFGFIISQPVRSCPVVYLVYTTFWLAIGLSVLQVVLGIAFLIWFLVTLFTLGQTTSGHQRFDLSSYPTTATVTGTPRTVAEALGESRGNVLHVIHARQPHSTPLRLHSVSLSSLRSRPYCSCHPKIGWLCLAGIFLAVLSAGLILSLVLVVSYVKYLNTSFIDEFRAVFVEAQVDFNSPSSSTPKSSLLCWNIVQSHYKCCGFVSYTDWYSPAGNTTNSSMTPLLPDSCYCTTDCDQHKTLQIDRSKVYATSCEPLILEAFTFKLHSSLIYFSVTLALLLSVFLVDLVYTLYTAYISLSLGTRFSNPSETNFNIQRHTSSISLEPIPNPENSSVVNGHVGRNF